MVVKMTLCAYWVCDLEYYLPVKLFVIFLYEILNSFSNKYCRKARKKPSAELWTLLLILRQQRRIFPYLLQMLNKETPNTRDAGSTTPQIWFDLMLAKAVSLLEICRLKYFISFYATFIFLIPDCVHHCVPEKRGHGDPRYRGPRLSWSLTL